MSDGIYGAFGRRDIPADISQNALPHKTLWPVRLVYGGIFLAAMMLFTVLGGIRLGRKAGPGGPG